jgi:DNA-binding transcriptional regulator YiaG
MANLANALKEEIGRIARKEIRQQTAGTAKSVAQGERDIAALKRQIEDLQRKLSSLRTQDAPKPTAGKKTATKKQDREPVGAASATGKQSSRARFSAKGLRAHRERIGLSADNYGKLIGVSGLSIYNWEQEKARPREGSIAALTTVRGIGKREAVKRLGALAPPKPKAKTKAKAKEAQPARDSKAASQGQAKSES